MQAFASAIRFGSSSGKAVIRPSAKNFASSRLDGLSSMNRALTGRSCISDINAAIRLPLGSQLTDGKTNKSHIPIFLSAASALSMSFLLHIELTIPISVRRLTRPRFASIGSTSPSERIPFQKVSSKSHITSLILLKSYILFSPYCS